MPSRRSAIAMSDAERRAFLSSAATLIVVSNGRNGVPHPMPMWFCVDADDCLYCTTFARSQKVRNFERDSRAALLVESGTAYGELKGVVIEAETQILRDPETVLDTLIRIGSRGERITQAQRESMRETAAKRVVLKFTPKKILSWNHEKLGGRY